VNYASALIFVSQLSGVEEKLQAAEAALQHAQYDAGTRNLIGHIAAIRATLAVAYQEVETIVVQSRRALEYLAPNNLPVRTATTWTLGFAYQIQGNRAAAARLYTEALGISQAIGHYIIHIMASIGLGNIQEAQTELRQAAATYQSVLQLAGEPPLPVACAAHLGLARIHYEWNDLSAARRHVEQSLSLARQLDTLDRVVAAELFLAHLQLAEGDEAGAAATIFGAEQTARRQNFVHRLPEVAAAQVLLLLRRGGVEAAARTAQTHDLPLSLARVRLAQGDAAAALALLEPLRAQAEERQWRDVLLQALILQVLALAAGGEEEDAIDTLAEALAMAEPSGCVRLFVDEGPPMARLLAAAAERGVLPLYAANLLSAFAAPLPVGITARAALPLSPQNVLIEPLSARELEILQLIAQGLSNQEIGDRLFLALDTVKGHNRRIFDKLQVQRRTEAVAKARALQLLPANQ
jgi:LuxR family maltose regulon positive regulatory protein